MNLNDKQYLEKVPELILEGKCCSKNGDCDCCENKNLCDAFDSLLNEIELTHYNLHLIK